MSMFLILLAAGESKRLKTSTPKPFIKINNLTLLEHAHNTFKDFKEINRIVIVYNKKHKRYLDKTTKGIKCMLQQCFVIYFMKRFRRVRIKSFTVTCC